MRCIACHHGCVILLFCAMVPVSPANAQPSGYEGYEVVRVTIANDADRDALHLLEQMGRDFQVWTESARHGFVEVRVAPTSKPALLASGLRYEVIVNDLQAHINDLYDSSPAAGFFDSLQTYDAHVGFMLDLAALYPHLAVMHEIGRSVERRPMWALRITGPGDNKPGVMYHGAQHGNEAAGASVVAYVANHLLTRYDTDPVVRSLVDNVEWYLLPIMNPDGYVAFDRWNANGVDLNRNWGGPGSPPSAFSERETLAMSDFFLTHPSVRVHIDVHGYRPWIMWPWGHTADLCSDDWIYRTLGSEIHDLLATAGGGEYEIGTVWSVAYPVYGGSTNYTYGELGLWAFTFEMIHAQVPTICQEFLSSMLSLAEWISDCNGNEVPDADDISYGMSTDCNDNAVPDECERYEDCNGNGVRDICDLALGTGMDLDEDGILDDCLVPKHRYISFAREQTTDAPAYHVTLTASVEFSEAVGQSWWVDVPDANGVSQLVSSAVFRSWYDDPAVTNIGDCRIVPAATYEIRSTSDGILFSDPVEVATVRRPGARFYGDVVGTGTGQLLPAPGFTPPNRVVNVTDIQAYVLTIQGPSSPSAETMWLDLHGQGDGTAPNFILNASDLQRIKFGFEGQQYADAPDHLDPADCP